MDENIWQIAEQIRINELCLLSSDQQITGEKALSISLNSKNEKMLYQSHNVKTAEQIRLIFNKVIRIIELDKKELDIRIRLYDSQGSKTVYYQTMISVNTDDYKDKIEIIEEALSTYYWMMNKYKFDFTDKDYHLMTSIIDIINSREEEKYGYLITRRMKVFRDSDGKINRELYYDHLIVPLKEIIHKEKIVPKGHNCYFYPGSIDLNNEYFIIQQGTNNNYLEHYNPFQDRSSIYFRYSYLAEYLIKIQNINKESMLNDHFYLYKQDYMSKEGKKI